MAGRSVGWICDSRFLDHSQAGHPECPERLQGILQELKSTGLDGGLVSLAFEAVDDIVLRQIHRLDQILRVRRISDSGGGHIDPDTYVSAGSYEIACLAAGGAVRATDAVVEGEVLRAFAAIRPPGHHATGEHSMGFCLFNNVALAAVRALSRGIARVLIVDWDVHHGNGTQDIFYGDPRVLYASVHQGDIYPGTGALTETGRGPGVGTTMNVPLPDGAGDASFRCFGEDLLAPIARRFRPELILISAGYDAHWRDPLAGLEVTTPGFAELARQVVALADELCQGRVVACLEGGYDIEALGASVAATIAALRGLPQPSDRLVLPRRGPDPEIAGLVEMVKRIHSLPRGRQIT